MVESLLFIILGAVLIITALLGITRTNPISSSLCLVFAFLSLASLYAMLSSAFVAAIQVLVYAGGILVLIIFVIMIMHLNEKDLVHLKPKYMLMLVTAVIVVAGTLAPCLYVLSRSSFFAAQTLPENFGSAELIGSVLFEHYLFPFEMLSLILLTAIVGVMVISKKKL